MQELKLRASLEFRSRTTWTVVDYLVLTDMAAAWDTPTTREIFSPTVVSHSVVAPAQPLGLEKLVDDASKLGSIGAVVVLQQDGKYRCVASRGESAPPVGSVLDLDTGISGFCLRTASAINCEDTELDPRVNAEVCNVHGIRSILAVPVMNGAHVAGLIEIVSDKPKAFAASHEERLTELATRMSGLLQPGTENEDETKNVGEPTSVSTYSMALEPLPDPISVPSVEGNKHQLVVISVAIAVVVSVLAIPAVIRLVRENGKRGVSGAHSSTSAGTTTTSKPSWENTASEVILQDPYQHAKALVEGPAPDLTEAYAWYVIAAGQGDLRAEENVRDLTSRMTESDIAKVRYRLGNIFERGDGISPNKEESYFWYSLAEHAGEFRASAALARLRATMSDAQEKSSEDRAAQWLKRHSSAKIQAQIKSRVPVGPNSVTPQ